MQANQIEIQTAVMMNGMVDGQEEVVVFGQDRINKMAIIIPNNKKYLLDQVLDISNNIPLHIDPKKTPNDFGFQKLCFPINTKEHEIRKLKEENIEKQILRALKTIKSIDDEQSIDLKVLKDKDDIKEFSNQDNKKQDVVKKSGVFSYEQHTHDYNTFMQEYLSTEERENGFNSKPYEVNTGLVKNKRDFQWGDETITYEERKELIRRESMNKAMKTGINRIDYDTKMRYDLWQAMSGFNRFLAFISYDNIFRAA